MTTNFAFRVINYKCFGDSPQGFDKIMPINVIIGKNNIGKSSLIEIIPQIISHQKSFIDENPKTQIIVTDKLTEEIISKRFPKNASGGLLSNYASHYQYGKRYIGKAIAFHITENKRTLIGTELPIDYPGLKLDFQQIVDSLHNPFKDKLFLYVTAERNILPEFDAHDIEVKPNGDGITSLITTIINNVPLDSELVQNKLFIILKKIVHPDIEIVNITSRRHSNNNWEIFLTRRMKDSLLYQKWAVASRRFYKYSSI